MKLLKLNFNKDVIPAKAGIQCRWFLKAAGSSTTFGSPRHEGVKAFQDDKTQKIFFGVVLFLCFVSDVHACSVCFKGDPNQTANVAARAGVLMMLGLVCAVLGLFAYFFLSIVKKSTTYIGKAK